MKGYDYAVLETYQRYITSVANAMNLEVSNGWAVPPQHFQVQRFKPQSAVTDSQYKLTLYERTIQVITLFHTESSLFSNRIFFQISDIAAPNYPILLRLAQAAQPEGVSITMVEHSDEYDEHRYVPDKDLKDLKNQLDEMGGPVTKKKK